MTARELTRLIQLEPRPRLRPASNTSFHHPPNEHQLTQNQKNPQKLETQGRKLEGQSKILNQ